MAENDNGIEMRVLGDQSELLDYPDEELRRIFAYNIISVRLGQS